MPRRNGTYPKVYTSGRVPCHETPTGQDVLRDYVQMSVSTYLPTYPRHTDVENDADLQQHVFVRRSNRATQIARRT